MDISTLPKNNNQYMWNVEDALICFNHVSIMLTAIEGDVASAEALQLLAGFQPTGPGLDWGILSDYLLVIQ